jgi:hypothetical protein
LLHDIVILDSDREDDGVPALNVMAHKARALLNGPLSERKAPAKRLPGESKAAKRERRRAEHAAKTTDIRRWVLIRADNKCEAVDPGASERCGRPATVLDHWEGGVGRRRQRQGIENCWLLCDFHNQRRTANFPNADWWNEAWAAHCRFWFYPFTPHLTRSGAGARETEGGEP